MVGLAIATFSPPYQVWRKSQGSTEMEQVRSDPRYEQSERIKSGPLRGQSEQIKSGPLRGLSRPAV